MIQLFDFCKVLPRSKPVLRTRARAHVRENAHVCVWVCVCACVCVWVLRLFTHLAACEQYEGFLFVLQVVLFFFVLKL